MSNINIGQFNQNTVKKLQQQPSDHTQPCSCKGWTRKVEIKDGWQTETYTDKNGQIKQITQSYDKNHDGKWDNNEFVTIDTYDYKEAGELEIRRYEDMDRNGDLDRITKYQYKNSNLTGKSIYDIDKSKPLSTDLMQDVQRGLFKALY